MLPPTQSSEAKASEPGPHPHRLPPNPKWEPTTQNVAFDAWSPGLAASHSTRGAKSLPGSWGIRARFLPRLSFASGTQRDYPQSNHRATPPISLCAGRLAGKGRNYFFWGTGCSNRLHRLVDSQGSLPPNVSGTRGLGYDVTHLQDQIRKTLGLEVERNIALVGAGNLGSALANYRGLLDAGFLLTNIFDASSQAIGTEVGGLTVQPMEELHSMEEVSIAIMAVPRRVAQSVADRLTEAGITSILNFAPKTLKLPDGVISRNVDLSTELQVLAYFDQ